MLATETTNAWAQFLEFIKQRCGKAEFENWFAPIQLLESNEDELILEVPNIFVQEYVLDNYQQDLRSFLPLKNNGDLAIQFQVAESKKEPPSSAREQLPAERIDKSEPEVQLNKNYTFANFIEGPSNQFIKNAAQGVALRPGKSYNPLFIHGGVGLGKTHLLHAIGHHVLQTNKKTRVHCITTEAFINELVYHLRNKTIDRMKRFYRNLDVLLVDDIQFLENRMNFEEEFCNTFESLINQSRQIVITCDKPPGKLKLSERMIARMEWGLVANIGVPDLETRVAILQHKAELKGLKLSSKIAFFIAEHVFSNVRQLEGAINRLGAYSRMMCMDITEDVVTQTLGEMLQNKPMKEVTVDTILSSVAAMYNVQVSDLKGNSRAKEVAFPRQVAMYLAKELIQAPLMKLASAFGGKKHSTLLHAWKKVSKQLESDDLLKRQLQMTRHKIES